MLYVKLLVLLVYEASFHGPISVGLCRQIQLKQNGYEGIIVGIDRNIPQASSSLILTSLKKLFTVSSQYLYQSTRKRSYFSKVTILVPPSWSREPEMNLSKSETYETADIKIEALGPVMEPHVDKMSVECGKGGNSIVIPEDFLSYIQLFATFGGDHDPGRWFVQLWSQFRYGIYDEHGYAGDKSYPYFYLDEKMTIPMPTACSTADLLLGDVIDVRSGKPCTTNEEILYGGFCEYRLSHAYDITNSSINYASYFSPIHQFCDTDENKHNDQAPTKQNAYCSYKSSWSVIEKNSDFQDGSNAPSEIVDLTPYFEVVYPSPRYIVLAFDCSEKTSGWTLQGVTSFIKYRLTFGTYIGIVSFSSEATTVLNITEVKTEADRQLVLDSLPTKKAEYETCVGCGLQESLKMLQETTTGNGGVIVMISDGNGTKPPFVSDIYSDVIKAEIQVYWIAFGNHTGDDLPTLVTETRGQIYSIDDDLEGVAAFASALFQITNYGQPFQTIMLVDELVTPLSDTDSSMSGEISIDWDVGRDIIVTALYDPGHTLLSPRLEIVGPNPSVTLPVLYTNSSQDGLLAASIPVAMPGSWTYHIEGAALQQEFSITATSAARSGGKPQITVEAWTNVGFEEVNSTERPVILFANVMKDSYPVLNADVKAVVTGPCQSITQVPLYDGGIVPDFKKLDGVYSRYFSSFCGSGRYRFQVRVRGGIGTIDYSGTQYSTAFERVVSGGSFMVGEFYSKMNDTIPPSRILDLKAIQNSSLRALSSALLEWTAPGDDYDLGTATVYEIKFSTSFSNVRGDGFLTNSNIVTPSMILHGSLSPLAAGSQQRVTVRFPSTTHSYFVSITTFDDSRNSPPESNVVQVLTLQTCQYQGQTFQDPDDCSIYYVCENPGFPATQMSCPSNLCYNSDLSACDWPS